MLALVLSSVFALALHLPANLAQDGAELDFSGVPEGPEHWHCEKQDTEESKQYCAEWAQIEAEIRAYSVAHAADPFAVPPVYVRKKGTKDSVRLPFVLKNMRVMAVEQKPTGYCVYERKSSREEEQKLAEKVAKWREAVARLDRDGRRRHIRGHVAGLYRIHGEEISNEGLRLLANQFVADLFAGPVERLAEAPEAEAESELDERRLVAKQLLGIKENIEKHRLAAAEFGRKGEEALAGMERRVCPLFTFNGKSIPNAEVERRIDEWLSRMAMGEWIPQGEGPALLGEQLLAEGARETLLEGWMALRERIGAAKAKGKAWFFYAGAVALQVPVAPHTLDSSGHPKIGADQLLELASRAVQMLVGGKGDPLPEWAQRPADFVANSLEANERKKTAAAGASPRVSHLPNGPIHRSSPKRTPSSSAPIKQQYFRTGGTITSVASQRLDANEPQPKAEEQQEPDLATRAAKFGASLRKRNDTPMHVKSEYGRKRMSGRGGASQLAAVDEE